MLARHIDTRPRPIIQRTPGHRHGPITRLVSPSGLGELIKPFVFLDFFDVGGGSMPTDLNMGWHPHSGIATVTVMLEGAVRYADTSGETGILPAGGVEWMRAGAGVWHTGAAADARHVRGFQLWVALPPELESSPSFSQYLGPQDVWDDGRVRVILGQYGAGTSPIAAPPMTYLAVRLEHGERWTYEPPKGHDVAWVAVHEGVLRAGAPVSAGEAAIFEPSEEAIEFVAEGKTGFVLGSAAKHPHDLVLGSYSVHTSAEALRRGEAEIQRIGRQLRSSSGARPLR